MISSAYPNRSTRRRFILAFILGAGVFLGAHLSPADQLTLAVQDASAQEKAEKKADDKAPGGMSAEDVAERIQKFYKKTADYQAQFTQTYTDVAAGDKKHSQGRVYFKKPGKMRWDYYAKGGKNREKVLVSDGSSFWIYEYEFKQVFKQCLADSQLPTSLKFLMGQGDLIKEFDVSFAKNSSAKKPVLNLVPKVPTSKYTRLVFELDPESFQVRQTTIYDPYGNTNQIRFSAPKLNKNLPDSGFDFKPPKDARLLNPQEKC